MDSSLCGEGPAILQLHKWDPCCLQLNLSEFREAFISPTRELLLLMSYQCEALLLPLIRGDSSNSSFLQCSQGESFQTSCPLKLHVATSNLPSRLDLKDDLQCASGSATDFDHGVPLEFKFPKSHSYPFVFDVKSLAWGVCGDTYNQHRDVFFREFLFVCSSQGVTVHAFCHSDQISALEGIVEGDFQQGRWMDWGPSESGPSMEEVVSSTACCEDTVIGGNLPNGHGVTAKGEDGYDGLSRSSASKRWLRSFFTKAETVESRGNIWTKFPGKLAFPSSANVVSFSIFDSPLVDFPSHGASSNKDECLQEAVLGTKNDMPTTSTLSSSGLNRKNTVSPDFFSVGGNGLSKCFRVFSSNSHRVIGFIFNLVDSLSVNISHDSEGSRGQKLLILIARLDSWGIRWVSSVKLDEHVSNCPVVDWTDFCFSDNLLVCLNASGLIFFYDAMSGDHIAHLDILQSCGLSPQSKLQEKQPIAADMEIVRKRTFRRLIVASYTSLLAAVDEYGVIYVICPADYVPDRYYSCDKFLPNFHRLGPEILVSWEVAGSDIGHQKLQCNFSCSSRVNDSSTGNGNSNFLDNPGSFLSKELHNCKHHGKEEQCDFCFSGFSSASKILCQRSIDSGVQSHLMRKIFLPTNGHDDNDCIFLSPLGITRLIRKHDVRDHNRKQIVQFDLHTVSGIRDDRCVDIGGQNLFLQGKEESHVGEAVGCTFQGCFYLVTETGLSVVLPSVSVSSNFLPLETLGYRQPYINTCIQHQGRSAMEISQLKQPLSPWKVEVLDRVLLYEGPEEADRLCLENGWDLKISRIRWLQLALHYLDFDEVARSLEMLVDVNLAEEGILRLLFAAVFLMVHKKSNDMEVSAASRLLLLATSFATKMIRNYGTLQLKKDAYILQGFGGSHLLSLPPDSPEKDHDDLGISGKLHEMARFLEIIRNMQCQLNAKYKKPGQGSVDSGDLFNLVDTNVSQDESQLSIVTSDSIQLETYNGQELSFPVSAMGSNNAEKLALTPKDTLDSITDDSDKVSALVLQAKILGKNVLPLENPKDMMARWKLDNLDLKTVVNDALLSGRLPLAVLQLHLHHSKDFTADKESPDTFTEVRDIGRAIAYDLFLKGETGLAVLTLQRLGEDIETCLKQLLFGTVRRSLRLQVAEEMRRFGYLGPYEWKMLDRILLVERLYPSGSFWKTFLTRQKELTTFTSSSPGGVNLCLLHPHFFNNLLIECGEIDGVVLGSWTSFSEDCSDHLVDEDGARAGYWAAAAVWSSAWDQKTIDRIALDQPFLMGVHVLWESKLEYYICHNDWEEIYKLLDVIPTSVLLNGSLQVALNGLQPSSVVEGDADFPDNGRYICSIDELDAMCMDIPGIRIFRFSDIAASSMWLRRFMEQKLARNLVFVKEYWEGTAEIVSLLAHSGFITRRNNIPADEDVAESPSSVGRHHVDTVQALHKLVVHHCVRHNLPNLLDLYLDNHTLVLDNALLCSLLEAAGECQWARWLLLSRIKGREYDASFSNARSIMSRALAPDSSLSVLDVDEIICNVDDIAEGGGEMAALATLMYAPAPVQNCLSSGSVKRHSGSSAQCTLENLRPTLQHFPTVWRTLVAASLGQDKACNFVATKTNNVLADYLNWRDNIFFSATRDTSLLQMLPCWFPKAVRRLIQLYVQGPLGWQSVSCLPTGESLLDRDVDFYINAEEHTEISAISWEATIQKHVEEELYDSSIEETGIGLEHHLHRGRALAAFNHILGIRVQKLKSEGQSKALTYGQANVQSDVQTLLAPIVPSEESLISFAIPLAITHFEDSVMVASCAFLLELCGLSASILRVDIAALRRISLYYKTTENSENYTKLSNGSAFHAVSHEGDALESLARALAEEYLHQHSAKSAKANPNSPLSRQPSRALMLVLQHLENASLPLMVHGKTCGSWLSTGDGNGNELRSQQKVASQHWNLVTAFCQMHQLPLSTKYLVVLARDNDWVGFLSEAQVGGYTFDTVVQVASKEFGDPRLKIHILTVLKTMQSRKKASSSSYSDAAEENETFFSDENIYIHAELFRILADCEKQKNPAEALLKKAKALSWSVLAMIASCFPDVSPLSCLTVWLEITAARETSSIKVNDIASQISDNVGAAVEATNIQPAGSKILTLHYNRQNPKRRRLMEPISVDASSDVSSAYTGAKISSRQGLMTEEKSKLEIGEKNNVSSDSEEGPASLSKMVAVLCEQRLFVPLLRAFDMFLPSCSLLPFIRALQAFSQMRLSEASAHLGSFSSRVKEEPFHVVSNTGREGKIGKSWMGSTAVNAADAMLSTCPSPYEKRCLLQLLAATDFGDGGSAATHYRRLYWKINLAEPSLRKDSGIHLGNETFDDGSLLTALEKSGYWEQARNWARQLEASGGPWKSAIHHVTESQAESMVAEWKEFLWDVPEERVALWGHCQMLFIRYSFPALQAGLFFLRHAEAVEKDLPARELHELLLLYFSG
ncbi:hypothetical protein HS088_TW22G01374 [Tripterygium wilfordii]|uniref:Spatacsin C-terminal domain-containing protein n=1 Tax=Tripterygium wilfordii TaxID=458696 RepID=A0A7J7C0Q5_TRIWF|nr:hypothetical protein HS088_TW22G01374 [Tripterygium wilfordii]